MAALGHASETPERLWNLAMAMTTAEEVASLAASARLAQVSSSIRTAMTLVIGELQLQDGFAL